MSDHDHDQHHHEQQHHQEEAHDHAYDATHHSGPSCLSAASEADMHFHQIDHATSTQIYENNQAREHAEEEQHKELNRK